MYENMVSYNIDRNEFANYLYKKPNPEKNYTHMLIYGATLIEILPPPPLSPSQLTVSNYHMKIIFIISPTPLLCIYITFNP